jgi:mannose-6-phosphate isomerase
MTAPLVLDPVFKERVWGGRTLETRFGYSGLPTGAVGECWGISAHPNGPSTVRNGPHAGETLIEVWQSDPAFFGGDSRPAFPLLVKFLDARDWLSVQVHPDDAQAVTLEGVPLGKTECWYVVAAGPGAELILGHRAADHDELVRLIDAAEWDALLLRRRVRPGDFVYVPSGTVHAVGPGLLICEVQQNCDTTYRVYDFDRLGLDGVSRDLHLDKAKQVLSAPYDPVSTDTAEPFADLPGGCRRTLVRGQFFEVTEHAVSGPEYRVRFPSYELVTVISGSGTLAYADADFPLTAGDHLVLPADVGDVTLAGELTLITSSPTPAPRGS